MSKKDSRESRLIRGDALLEERGIDLEAPDEELFPALVAAIGSEPDADLSIADLLGSIATEESARRLVTWDAAHPADKDLRRKIRTSLFRLEQRGVAAAVREAAPRDPARIIEPVEPVGYLSPLDGAGSRLAWIAKPRPEGGQILLNALINDRIGMRQFHALNVKRAQMKELFDDSARHLARMVKAPHRYVDWLMFEAYRKGSPRDERGGDYLLFRADLYTEPAAETPNPVHEMMEASGFHEDPSLLENSSSLLDEKEFRGWYLPDDMVKVQQARFRDARDSTVVISEAQMEGRLDAIIQQTFDEVFQGAARQLYSRRMADMALWYTLSDRPSPAGMCHAVHGALADPSRPLKEVTFLHGLVFRSFADLLEEAARPGPGDEPSPSSLIVRP